METIKVQKNQIIAKQKEKVNAKTAIVKQTFLISIGFKCLSTT